MDDRGQTSTEYLLLTAIGVLVAIIGYLSVVTLMDKAAETVKVINDYRIRLVNTLGG